METTQITRFEAQIDAQLADCYERAGAIISRLRTTQESLLRYANSPWHYKSNRSRVRVYDMSHDEALAAVRAIVAEHEGASEYTLVSAGYHTYSIRNLRNAVEAWDNDNVALSAIRDEERKLEEQYTGWSRFFLVTNANGHIHSSMHCSTCHPTTSFAWLPTLSGLTEADAVAEHGPLLCSVCFPSAPVEWTIGKQPEADPAQCPGSGTYDHNSSGTHYYYRRAECNHCGHTVSVTSTGKLRKHKREQ